jgi:hypothetical protein
MPKFRSQLVATEKRGKDGQVIKSGEAIAIPVDDAAMLEPISDTAVEMGLVINPLTEKPYTMPEFRAKQAELTDMFKKREIEANKRRAVM